MKNVLNYGIIIGFILITGVFTPINAQNALGCDGQRYVVDRFPDTTLTTVQYGSNTNAVPQVQALYVDIVQPKNDTLSKRPLIIWAFGGGFISGTRQTMREFCNTYAKKGYVCATIDYRLYSGNQGFVDSIKMARIIVQALQDMKASVRFFRKSAANGNPYKVDVNNIIVGGVSAGAITAMNVAQMDSTDPIAPWLRNVITAEGGFEGNSGNAGYSSAVKGCISMSGALYRKEYLDTGDVPFASYHGTVDNIVPYDYGFNVYGFTTDGSAACHRRAFQLGIQSILVTANGGGHTDIYPPNTTYAADFATWIIKATTFMKRLVCGEPSVATQEVDNQEITLYPNPSSDQISLKIEKNTEGGAVEICIFDALGRMVFCMKNDALEPIVLNKTDVGGAGIYIVKCTFESTNKTVVKKINFSE